jgi:hypothetical protein
MITVKSIEFEWRLGCKWLVIAEFKKCMTRYMIQNQSFPVTIEWTLISLFVMLDNDIFLTVDISSFISILKNGISI